AGVRAFDGSSELVAPGPLGKSDLAEGRRWRHTLAMISRAFRLAALVSVCVTATAAAQADKQGVTYRAPSGATLKLMLDDSNVGPEVTVGELTFPPNSDSGEHAHGSIEMFYVLSGELEHVVNGKSQMLKPGMTGYVRPPDKIRHKTGPAGAKVVVIWVPGDEAKKIVARWTKEP
ncbi:MAG: cupin domain-containing protein, partial [bacterium]